MSTPNPYQLTIARTAELLGGMDALSKHLQVGRDDLRDWERGASKPPAEVFLRVVDVLIRETRKPKRG